MEAERAHLNDESPRGGNVLRRLAAESGKWMEASVVNSRKNSNDKGAG
jgi:hypothetical protein